MATADHPDVRKAGFRFRFHPRILGTPAPVFPGFEIDISQRVEDAEKPDAVWHRDRSREMLRAHPEIKDLFGPAIQTAFWCLLMAASQVALAAASAAFPWWMVIAAAWLLGSWININLFNLAHECNHHLVFRRPSWNRWMFTITSLPMCLSGHHTWWIEHHVHHNDLGAKKDFITRRRSFLLLTRPWNGSPMVYPYSLMMLVLQLLRSVIGLVSYLGDLLRLRLEPSDRTLAILADQHLISGYARYGIQHWAVVYPLASLTMVGTLFWYGGWKPVVYLLFAQAFMTGFLHPVMFGLILSNSHFHGHRRYQPSSSYYGWLNWITFNFGLHTEHHDLAKIPWSRLPKVRRIAPEFYDDLVQTDSYAKLAFRFVFGSKEVFENDFNNEVHRNAQNIDAPPERTSA